MQLFVEIGKRNVRHGHYLQVDKAICRQIEKSIREATSVIVYLLT